jgi:Lrp/AsnC family transcriptional regulator, leucine-responsive regulatory protein
MIDGTDRKILQILQSEARTSNAEIARTVGLAPSATLERIRKLEKKGVIQGYEARLNPRAVGLGLLAYVFVKTDEDISDHTTGDHLAELPEVQEVHHVAGEDCYLAKVRAKDPESLGLLLREKFGAIPTVVSTRTTVVLETVKASGLLPLPEED